MLPPGGKGTSAAAAAAAAAAAVVVSSSSSSSSSTLSAVAALVTATRVTSTTPRWLVTTRMIMSTPTSSRFQAGRGGGSAHPRERGTQAPACRGRRQVLVLGGGLRGGTTCSSCRCYYFGAASSASSSFRTSPLNVINCEFSTFTTTAPPASSSSPSSRSLLLPTAISVRRHGGGVSVRRRVRAACSPLDYVLNGARAAISSSSSSLKSNMLRLSSSYTAAAVDPVVHPSDPATTTTTTRRGHDGRIGDNNMAMTAATLSSSDGPAGAAAATAPEAAQPSQSQSPIATTPLALEHQRDSIERLLAYPPGSYTPETFYEAEDLLQRWSLMRTVESVSYTLQLLDRILLVENCPTIDVDLVNRVLNNWRVVWWTYDGDTVGNGTATKEAARHNDAGTANKGDRKVDPPVVGYAPHELTPHDMYRRLLSYLDQSDACVNEKSFYLVLEAAVTNGDPTTTAQLGQSIFDTAVQLGLSSDAKRHLLPSTDLCNLAMRAQIESHGDTNQSGKSVVGDEADRNPMEKVAATVRYCESVVQTMRKHDINLNRITYHRLIQAQTLTQSLDGALVSEQLLRQMQSEHSRGMDAVEPSYFTYVLVLTAWAESGSKDAGARAEVLFREVTNSTSELCAKHVAVFNKVLRCHASQGTIKGAKRALTLLNEQERKDDQKPNYLSYSTVLTGLAKAGLAPEAEDVLKRVPEEYLDTTLFTKVIMALSKDKRSSALSRANAIFDRMKVIAKTNPNVTPNLYTYNALLDCFAKCRIHDFAATDASRLFEELQSQGLEPNLMTYSSLLHCWARFGLVNQALEVLHKVPHPDLYLYNIVLSAFINYNDPRAAPWALQILRCMPENGIEPDVYSYNAVISAYANSNNRSDATTHSRTLLSELKDRYRKTGDVRYRPTGVTYNAVMNAYARAHRPDDAERVLTEMFDDYLNHGNQLACPDVTSFNTVLKAIAFAKNKNGVSDKADALFRRMESLASTIPHLAPNVITYTTLVLCHGLSRYPQRAEAALRDMQSKHEAGLLREGPNLKTYQTLRKAWSTSHDPDKKSHVERIQNEIEARFGTQMKGSKSRA